MSYYRNYKIEMDYLCKVPPMRLYGGRLDRVGVECQTALLTIPVRSLSEIEPFRYYDVVVRRHFPEWGKGLPLKIKCLGHIALEPKNYIGAGFKKEFGGHYDGDPEVEIGPTAGEEGSEVEVIEERVPAEVFDATMFGFGNAAMLDDIICRDNSPYPFIRFYVNDEGKFVIMPCETYYRDCGCRPKRLIVKHVEVIREPFKAHTLAIKRTATPYVHPQRVEETEHWTQGNFGCGYDRGYRY